MIDYKNVILSVIIIVIHSFPLSLLQHSAQTNTIIWSCMKFFCSTCVFYDRETPYQPSFAAMMNIEPMKDEIESVV